MYINVCVGEVFIIYVFYVNLIKTQKFITFITFHFIKFHLSCDFLAAQGNGAYQVPVLPDDTKLHRL